MQNQTHNPIDSPSTSATLTAIVIIVVVVMIEAPEVVKPLSGSIVGIKMVVIEVDSGVVDIGV